MKKIKLIKDLNELDLMNLCELWNYPKFHGTQIYKWLFQKRCNSMNEMSDLPLNLKNMLNIVLLKVGVLNFQRCKKKYRKKYVCNFTNY